MTGTGVLLGLALRRDRLRLPLWVAATAGVVALQSRQSQATYGTEQALAAYRSTAEANGAVIVLAGPPVGLDTVAGAIAFEIWTTVCVVVALMNVFTVARHTRADEEAGRTELLRAGRLGRHAPLAAAVGAAAVANAGVLVAVAGAGVVTGLPATGSLLFGAALAVYGLVSAGVTGVAAQVLEHTRSVQGAAAAVVGVALVVRAAGDVREDGLSWASPMGWVQATHPYSGDRWWPLLLGLGATAVLLVAARALVDRRDLGAGLVAVRPGPATASRTLSGPLGLAWRLQRGTVVGWAAGVAVTGLFLGLMVDTIEELAAEAPDIAAVLGSADDLVDAYLALCLVLTSLLAAAYGTGGALRARSEEAEGRAEPVLATRTSRHRWLVSHLVVALVGSAALTLLGGAAAGAAWAVSSSDAGEVPRLLAASAVLVPAVWTLVALAAALVGWAPRATALVWVAVAYVVTMAVLADSLGWPDSVRVLSPWHHLPLVPLEDATPVVPGALLAGSLVLLVLALVGFRRRDLTTA